MVDEATPIVEVGATPKSNGSKKSAKDGAPKKILAGKTAGTKASKKTPAGKTSGTKASKKTAAKKADGAEKGKGANFPRHTLERALRIPKAIIEQNASREATQGEVAKWLGVGDTGPFRVEVSSSIKYGLVDRPSPGKLAPTDLAKRILRPQKEGEEIEAKREAVLKAPVFSDVYKHYRGEYLPDPKFFDFALTDTFEVPGEKISEFKSLLTDALEYAGLVEKKDGKTRLLDVSGGVGSRLDATGKIAPLAPARAGTSSCFVMMPFAEPIGTYYAKIYEPAIQKAGLRPVRADASIFGTGKIMDQVWTGIEAADVLVAELTDKNPNVYYELGLAHAMKKPVVLVSRNEQDVPFDLQHIRVIYYDTNDPFWGEKLINKVAENILSALKNPSEATFSGRASPA